MRSGRKNAHKTHYGFITKRPLWVYAHDNENYVAPSQSILVVEDDPDVLLIAVAILETEGYQTFEANGSDQALAVLAKNLNVSLVFSDIQMPGRMDGIALAIHLHEAMNYLPVLLTSARGSNFYKNYPRNTPFLGKPYSRESLLAAIAAAVIQHKPDEKGGA